MDQFNFNAPIHTLIIFDENDDENFETKPSVGNIGVKDEFTNHTLKIEQVQDKTEKERSNSLCIPLSRPSKIEECVLLKSDIESTLKEISNNIESITEKISKEKNELLKKTLPDMPLLEEGINNIVDNHSTSTKGSYQNYKPETKNNNKQSKQKTKETTTKVKKVSKRRLTQELSSSDKSRKVTKLSAELTLTKHIDPTNKGNSKEIHEDCNTLVPLDFNNSELVQNSSQPVVYSKYFTEFPSHKDIRVSPTKIPKENVENNTSDMINNKTDPLVQTSNQENTSSQSNNEVNNTIVAYIKGLLYTVSEHMIYILNSFQDYLRLSQSKVHPTIIENAKNNYIRTRNHFFCLSYSSVVNVIIPRNKDSKFVKNFLTNTTRLAQSKCYNYSYEQIEPLYIMMIEWAQRKQLQIQNMNNLSSAMASQEIQKSSSGPDTNQNQLQESSKVSRQNLTQPSLTRHVNESFDLHSPNRLVQPHSILFQRLHNDTPRGPPPPYLSQNQQHLEINSTTNDYGTLPYRFPEQNNNAMAQMHDQYTHGQQYQNQTPNAYTHQNALQNLNINIQQTQNQVTNMQSFINNNTDGYGWLHQNVPSWAKSQSNWAKDVSHVQNTRRHSQELSPYNQHLQPENNQLDTNRSSISRDSGFMSPLNFNVSNDIPLPEENRPQPSTMPLITHVTSLNPNAPLIKDGYCAVCGKITKQKCLGCFNCYYCGHDCQSLDWKVHALVCKK